MSSFVESAVESVRSRPSGMQPSPEDYVLLFERLEREAESARRQLRKEAHDRVWELAKLQGVEPVHDIEDLRGEFWPEDENTDEFLLWLRATRQKDENRSIPE